MSKRKVIKFVLPVVFEYASEKALHLGIKMFLKDPIFGCYTSDDDNKHLSWECKKPVKVNL